jgi:hypothetical protein
LFRELGYGQVAEIVNLLVTDKSLRAQVALKQRERLTKFAPKNTEVDLRDVIARFDPSLA